MKKALFLIMAFVLLFSLTACATTEKPAQSVSQSASQSVSQSASQSASQPSQSQQSASASASAPSATKKVGLLTYSLGEEFGVDILSGAKKAAEKAGIEIIAPDPSGDLQKQISQLEDMVQRKLDAVIIAPIDGSAIVPYLKEAMNAGVKIINYDIQAGVATDALILCDNKLGGKMAAEYLVEKLGKKGKVLIMEDNPGVVCIAERVEGFAAELAKYPDIKVVRQLSNGTRDTHQKTMENMLTAHPDLKAVFCPDGDHTLGAYAACKQMSRTDVLVCGYDASPEQITIMKQDGNKGNLICSVAQYPILIGRVCVETTAKVLAGEKMKDTIYADIGMAKAPDAANFKFLE